VDGILVERRILDPPLHLVAHHGPAAAGVDHHAGADPEVLVAHGEDQTGVIRFGEVDPSDGHP